MTTPLSAAQLERLRRDAKKLARKKSIRRCEAQQELATQRGYPNWSQLVKASKAFQQQNEKTLRRAFTSLFVRRYGAPSIATIAGLLGHSDGNATSAYLHALSTRPERLRSAASRAAPTLGVCPVGEPRTMDARNMYWCPYYVSSSATVEQEVASLLGHVSSDVTRKYMRPRRSQEDGT